MTFHNQAVVLAAAALLAVPGVLAQVALAQDATAQATPALAAGPERITIQHPGLMPEGIEYDPLTDQFLLGSLTDGVIRSIGLDGTATDFAHSDKVAASRHTVRAAMEARMNFCLVITHFLLTCDLQ